MDLQQVRYAMAVIDEGTFTAAALACHVAQPSLSQSVQRLERELGAALFHRIGRRVTLTPAGEAFAAAARPALRSVEGIATAVGAIRGVVAGHLDLVALPTLAMHPVAGLVASFRAAHAGVVVRLTNPDDTADLVRMVQRGDSEIGVTEQPARGGSDGLVVHPLGRQEIVAVLPPGARRHRSIDAAAFASLPIVAQTPGTSTRGMLDRFMADAGIAPDLAVQTDQREAIVPLVLAGAGAALLPRPMAHAAGLQGAVLISLSPALWRDVVLVHRDAPLTPAAVSFLASATAAPGLTP